MRPRRPKQYCLQLVTYIYIYIYVYIYIYIYIYIFVELDYLVEDIYCYSEFHALSSNKCLRPNNPTLQIYIALVYLLSTSIADEIFNSLYYYIYIYIYMKHK